MTAMPASATALLIELARCGIDLQAHGDKLRYRPRAAMTPDLADRVRAYKPELLVIAVGQDITSVSNGVKPLPEAASGASQVEWWKPHLPLAYGGLPTGLADSNEDGAEPPPGVTELAAERDGWSPVAWRDRLLQLAERCQQLNQARADQLRRAACMMTPDWREVFEERAGVREYDGEQAREHAEREALAETFAGIRGSIW